MTVTRTAKYWAATIPYSSDWEPSLCENVLYIKGQQEIGSGGFHHWQLFYLLKSKQRLSWLKSNIHSTAHWEPCNSAAYEEYIWKEETRVADSQFELGKKPMRRNSETDWEMVRANAIIGNLAAIPADVYVRSYHSLRAIAKDNCIPKVRGVQEVNIYWGKSGSGKTHRAFLEMGDVFYLKASTTKWWDAYNGEENILVDEFRGQVDVSHLLKWLDRYPCAVEIKGSQVALKTKRWWFTSNMCPESWYAGTIGQSTVDALFRRFTNIVQFTETYVPPPEPVMDDLLEDLNELSFEMPDFTWNEMLKNPEDFA